jgi:hypothetical protein
VGWDTPARAATSWVVTRRCAADERLATVLIRIGNRGLSSVVGSGRRETGDGRRESAVIPSAAPQGAKARNGRGGVIPSGAPKVRRRGIAVVPTEGPSTGTGAIFSPAPVRGSAGMNGRLSRRSELNTSLLRSRNDRDAGEARGARGRSDDDPAGIRRLATSRSPERQESDPSGAGSFSGSEGSAGSRDHTPYLRAEREHSPIVPRVHLVSSTTPERHAGTSRR